jgi:hypothetical protein
MNKKPMWGVGLVVILVLAVMGGMWVREGLSQRPCGRNPCGPFESIGTSDWKTYKHNNTSIRHPSDWNVKEVPSYSVDGKTLTRTDIALVPPKNYSGEIFIGGNKISVCTDVPQATKCNEELFTIIFTNSTDTYVLYIFDLIIKEIKVRAEMTADWKMYSNTSEKYSLKYPTNWYLYDSYDPKMVTITNVELLDGRDGPGSPEDIYIGVNTNIDLLQNETLESLASRAGLSNTRSILVDGIKAIRGHIVYTGEDESGYYQKGELSGDRVLFIHNGKGYQIVYSPYGSKFVSTFDQILSTFKFTSPTPSASVEKQPLNRGTTNTSHSIKVVSPKGGETYKIGSKVIIKWNENGGKDMDEYTIVLGSPNNTSLLIAHNYPVRVSGIDGISAYEWTVPQLNTNGKYKIEVYRATARELTGRSGEFTITN